jgi:hypothetical protein
MPQDLNQPMRRGREPFSHLPVIDTRTRLPQFAISLPGIRFCELIAQRSHVHILARQQAEPAQAEKPWGASRKAFANVLANVW